MTQHANYFYKNTYSSYWHSKRPISYSNTPYDDFLLTLIPPQASHVLEACCGNGIPFSLTLAKKGLNVFGFDISDSLVEYYNKLHPYMSATVDDIHSFGTSDSYDCLFSFHSIHLVPHPYKAVKALIDHTPNVATYIFEFPSIYCISNSSIYFHQERLHASHYNWPRLLRLLRNLLKYILRKGTVDKSSQNLYQPLSIYRVLDIINLPFVLYGIKTTPFNVTKLPYPISADHILEYDRFVVVFNR